MQIETKLDVNWCHFRTFSTPFPCSERYGLLFLAFQSSYDLCSQRLHNFLALQLKEQSVRNYRPWGKACELLGYFLPVNCSSVATCGSQGILNHPTRPHILQNNLFVWVHCFLTSIRGYFWMMMTVKMEAFNICNLLQISGIYYLLLQ